MLSPLLKYGFDGVIGSAGGYIECMGKVIYDCPMTNEQQKVLLKLLKENGSEELKIIADDICASVEKDGLLHAFEKYQLL